MSFFFRVSHIEKYETKIDTILPKKKNILKKKICPCIMYQIKKKYCDASTF